MAAAAFTSTAATAVSMHRIPAAKNAVVFSPLLNRSKPISTISLKPLKELTRHSQLVVKASSSDETPLDANELFTDLKEKWDGVENKPTVILYGGGAVVAVWLASTVVGAVNSIPLVPKIMELVGVGYTGWFVYRYLLFKSSRNELATDIEEIKRKIAGAVE